MSTLQILPLARKDLMDIWLYYSEFSEEVADALLDEFDRKFQLLLQQPHAGKARPKLLINGLRSFLCKEHLIYYIPIDEGIKIVRILHSRRDIDTAFSLS